MKSNLLREIQVLEKQIKNMPLGRFRDNEMDYLKQLKQEYHEEQTSLRRKSRESLAWRRYSQNEEENPYFRDEDDLEDYENDFSDNGVYETEQP